MVVDVDTAVTKVRARVLPLSRPRFGGHCGDVQRIARQCGSSGVFITACLHWVAQGGMNRAYEGVVGQKAPCCVDLAL